jgi:carbon-monoxide dehydrogenase iron sulfur subunit
VAVKCDNCSERQLAGLIPACVEVCKSGALRFEEKDAAMKRKTNEVARTVSAGIVQVDLSPGFTLLNAIKRQNIEFARQGGRQ